MIMAEDTMSEQEIAWYESKFRDTSWTRNDFLEENGFLLVKDLYDVVEMYSPPPQLPGKWKYFQNDVNNYSLEPVEPQVNGSTARYWHPQYRQIHTNIRLKIEKIIGRKLYNTYYYDRFYNPGQKLRKHVDREACEISVSVHIGTNIKGEGAKWPFWIKTPDTYDETDEVIIERGAIAGIIMEPGDGVIYKGCERPHWREPLPLQYKKGLLGKKERIEGLYYHQIFFHYVLADGQRWEFAWDMG